MIGKAVAVVLLVQALLAASGHGFCYRKNPPKPQESAELLQQPGNYSIWVCVQSTDLPADLEKAPKQNITQIWFSMSSVERLENNAFARFAEKLVDLEIWSSKLADIEDKAFRGLRELKGLILPRNELTTVKATWFMETPKLRELNLANNHISSIEVEFLKSLPALINLDLRGNEIVSLPGEFVKQLPATLRRLNVYNNPLNFRQLTDVMEWSKAKDDKANEPKLLEMKHVFAVTKGCVEDKAITNKSTEGIDKCVEDRMNNEIALMAGNATNATTTPKP